MNTRKAISTNPERALVAGSLPKRTRRYQEKASRKEHRSSRILVADDVEANREILQRRLTRQGYEVVPAENGRTALDLLAEGDFDLVLLDVMMPELAGDEVLKAMKKDSRMREIPVIMISALDEVQRVASCIELGAEDYLAKPFDGTILNARIKASLEKKRLRDQELVYLTHVERVVRAAIAVEQNNFDPASLDETGRRTDELGHLARTFCRMAAQVAQREQKLQEEVEQLRINIDFSRKEQEVRAILESDYFQRLQDKVRLVRQRMSDGLPGAVEAHAERTG